MQHMHSLTTGTVLTSLHTDSNFKYRGLAGLAVGTVFTSVPIALSCQQQCMTDEAT